MTRNLTHGINVIHPIKGGIFHARSHGWVRVEVASALEQCFLGATQPVEQEASVYEKFVPANGIVVDFIVSSTQRWQLARSEALPKSDAIRHEAAWALLRDAALFWNLRDYFN